MDTDGTQIGEVGAAAQYPEKALTERVIGAAYEVHRELGSGFLEKVYETALLRELVSGLLRCEAQAEIKVSYKGAPVGVYFADLLVDGKVICEIKAVRSLIPEHQAQLLNYLKATGFKVGLLINLSSTRVQVKRMVY
jgi:GxxExxY protein